MLPLDVIYSGSIFPAHYLVLKLTITLRVSQGEYRSNFGGEET